MKGFVVYSDYYLEEENTAVRLFGKLENGHSFVSMSRFEPYFFIKESDLKKIEKYLSKYKTEKTALTSFKGEKLVKISAHNSRTCAKRRCVRL